MTLRRRQTWVRGVDLWGAAKVGGALGAFHANLTSGFAGGPETEIK